MNAQATALFARLTEVERIKIRLNTTEAGIVGLYHDYKPELPGGKMYPGTEEEGIAAMKEVHAAVVQKFIDGSRNMSFGNTWLF